MRAVCLFALCCSCSEPRISAGDFRLVAQDDGFALLGPDGGTLIDHATVSTRQARAKFEMQYGSFRITEPGAPAWADAVKARITNDRIELSSADGVPVATARIASSGTGVVGLTLEGAAGNRLALAWACRDDDAFLGFGAQADALNHRGHTVPIWTSEPGIGKSDTDDPPELWFLVGARHASSFGLPSWLSNRGYVAVLDFDGRSIFELCSVDPKQVRAETWASSVTLWFFTGATPAQALERATAGLLGRPKRPPPVAFAPWNDAIYGPDAVRAVAVQLRDAGVPSSVLWTEDFRGGTDTSMGYRLKEEWDTDPALYPDAGGFSRELAALGFEWHAYFNTFIVQGTRVYDEAVDAGHFVRNDAGTPRLFDAVTFQPTGLADLSREATRTWMKSYLQRAVDTGFQGWMADYGEWLPYDAVLSSGEDPLLAHNRYPLEWAKLNAEVLGDRVFFARAGWLGSTAYTPVVWAGDQRTDFQADDGLPTVVPMGLGLGLGGVSTYGHDIAGYQSATNPPSTKELFMRWTVVGALSPVMRTHHGLSARQNWRFDSDAETLAWFRKWATLHIRLFPYLDGASVEAETRGLPLMRALPLMFPAEGWSIADEYVLGPFMLVAPQLTAGATRSVHVPAGEWTRLDGGVVSGPAELPGDPDSPVLLRAGAVIPLLPEGVQTLLGALPAARELWVVRGADGQFVERDGTTYTLKVDAAATTVVPIGQAVRMTGATLSANGVTLEVSGGPARTYDVVFR